MYFFEKTPLELEKDTQFPWYSRPRGPSFSIPGGSENHGSPDFWGVQTGFGPDFGVRGGPKAGSRGVKRDPPEGSQRVQTGPKVPTPQKRGV